MPNKLEQDQLLGGLYGLLIGDAVGVPYEFKRSSDIPAVEEIDMVPPVNFKKGWMKAWSNIPTGTWSDDGALSLCLLEALMQGRVTQERIDTFVNKALRWKNEGYLAVDNNRFDIGNQTNAALTAIESGLRSDYFDPIEADENSNGNGSLMRTLPVALFYTNKVEVVEMVEMAGLQSHITHPHQRSKLCCMMYALIARNLLLQQSKQKAINNAVQWMTEVFHDDAEWSIVVNGENYEARGTGYVVDSLWSAIAVFLQGDSFEHTVRLAVKLGNDTDTTACIAGGLAGIVYGVTSFSEEWIDQLREKETVIPIARELLRHHGLLDEHK